MNKPQHLITGEGAEAHALRWLTQQGLQLVAKNFRCKCGELDLVMLHNEALVIVEVRFRATTAFGHPAETVNHSKQHRIIAATELFLRKNPQYASRAIRFDVMALHGNSEPEWIQDAFQAR